MQSNTCIVNGVSCSKSSGSIYTIEGTITPGKTGLHITGDFSDSVLETFKQAVNLATLTFEHNVGVNDSHLHIHIPKPLDGKSCGLPIFICLYGLLSGKTPSDRFVFTGELSNASTLYPIGGLSQKISTARLNGFQGIVFPLPNDPVQDTGGILLCPVRWLSEALGIAFGSRLAFPASV